MIKKIYKHENIAKIYTNKAYDNKPNFNLSDKLLIEPVISIRRNTNGKNRKVLR